MTEKERALMFKNIWCCAFQRSIVYKNTQRYFGEMETVQMCLSAAQWEKFCNTSSRS